MAYVEMKHALFFCELEGNEHANLRPCRLGLKRYAMIRPTHEHDRSISKGKKMTRT